MRRSNELLYLSRADVESLCRNIDSVGLVREIFALHGRGETTLPEEAYLAWCNERGEPVRSLAMPAYLGAQFRAAGVKIINSNPSNPFRGIPRAAGLTLLFDADTAAPRCLMEGAYISSLRTASVSVLAVELLSAAPECLCMIGCGVIGAAHLNLALARWSSLRRVLLFDRDRRVAETTAEALRQRHPTMTRIDVVDEVGHAVRAGDVVVPATTATCGYIPFEWLRRGSVVVNVSLDDLLPDVFLKADLLFVDDWHLVTVDTRRLLGRMASEGRVAREGDARASCAERLIDGELGDLISGVHKGRRSEDDVVVVNPFGLAIEDVAFAARIFDLACRQQRGQWLPV